MKKLLTIILFLALLIPNAFSIAVSPGRIIVKFTPSLEQELKFDIINQENKEMITEINIDGELKDYVILSQKQVIFKEGESAKSLKYIIKLPAELSPGRHTANIIVKEIPSSSSTINPAIALISQLYVEVPYPGKYLIIDGVEAKEEENVKFRIGLLNNGKEDIKEAYAIIKVKNGNETLFESRTMPTSVASTRRSILETVWEDKKVGNYTLGISIDYDGNKMELSDYFNVVTAKAAKEAAKEEKKPFALLPIIIGILLLFALFFAFRKFNIFRKGN